MSDLVLTLKNQKTYYFTLKIINSLEKHHTKSIIYTTQTMVEFREGGRTVGSGRVASIIE